MDNMEYLKRSHYNKYRKYFKNDDIDGFMNMYEQIKSEVANSVFQWLNLYVANDNIESGDLKPTFPQHYANKGSKTEFTSPNFHSTKKGCYCNWQKHGSRTKKSARPDSQIRSPEYSTAYESGSPCSTPTSFDSLDKAEFHHSSSHKSYRKSQSGHVIIDCPNTPDLVLTEFRAQQVWPEWCQILSKGRHPAADSNTVVGGMRYDRGRAESIEQSPVYYDRVNDRLCVYRNGMVEYPQTPLAPPQSTTNVQANLMSNIPQVQSLEPPPFPTSLCCSEESIPAQLPMQPPPPPQFILSQPPPPLHMPPPLFPNGMQHPTGQFLAPNQPGMFSQMNGMDPNWAQVSMNRWCSVPTLNLV